jgi:hypothetical protein
VRRPAREGAARAAAIRTRGRRGRAPIANGLLAGALCALLAGGCGGGGSSRRSPAEASTPAAPNPPYRWLVPTDGPAPTIAVENEEPGTSSWRLAGPSTLLGGEARGAVDGYVARQAVAAGEVERIYVNAPGAQSVTLRVYRMGWYGGDGGRLVLETGAVPISRQPPCRHRRATGLTECRWHPTLSFPIPAALPSGVYIVKLEASDGAQSDSIFVVRARPPAPLLVELPTATWEAYNTWGGDSLYPGGSRRVGVTGTRQGVEVSFDRPYASQTGAGQFFVREVAMVRFLERYGYPLSYTTIESIDAEPGQLAGAHAVLDVGHSEYWSERAERALAAARDRGTNLIFMSSDTMGWRARFERATAASSEARQAAHRITSYKEHAFLDPLDRAPSGLFPHGGANLVGSAYNGCITPRLGGPGPPVYHYFAWTPAASLKPDWLFAGTGITAATSIPGIVGYELDQRTRATPRGAVVVGSGSGQCRPIGTSPTRGTIAESTLYTARSGAFVFATGTLGWLYALSLVPQASPDVPRAPDPRVVAMTRNLLARALGR